jgi:hypothetical protein
MGDVLEDLIEFAKEDQERLIAAVMAGWKEKITYQQRKPGQNSRCHIRDFVYKNRTLTARS